MKMHTVFCTFTAMCQVCYRLSTPLLANNKINILGQYLKTNDEIGYVVLDLDRKISNTAVQLLKEVKDTIKVRLLY